MTQLRERPCRLDDAAAIADLINAAMVAGGGRGGYAASEVEQELRRSPDTRALLDPDDRLIAAALVPRPPEGGDHVELIGAVDPAHRGQGIGRDLLAWQLAHAGTWEPQVIAAVSDTHAIRLFERAGFTPMRYFLEMSAPTGVPAIPAPGTVRITGFDPSQTQQLYRVHADAFHGLWGHQEQSWAEWSAATVDAAHFRPELARLAMVDDAIVAYVLPYDRGTLYIGQVGTAQPWRRHGIAAALLTSVLAAAEQAGYRTATLDADSANPTGAPAVYTRAGFVVDQHIAVYRRTPATTRL
ncbi:GNAT family N-acetyltransferase [Dactylosporangium sp. CS-047395]|uniref:GNAT family N-acetyltransferase n=1 Tax=Dactylosporangium sp. CS-047395 TaxID=3239936 RepID=UPI003D918F7C